MNENTAKLVVALRSGEYRQGQHYLRPSEDEFCCLGVACDLYRKEHPDNSEWSESELNQAFIVHDGDEFGETESDTELPTAVMEWLGWDSSGGDVSEDAVAGIEYESNADRLNLAALNDAGLTFDQIAEVIERQWA